MSERTELDAFEELRSALRELDQLMADFEASPRGSEEASNLARAIEEHRDRLNALLGEITVIVKRKYHVP